LRDVLSMREMKRGMEALEDLVDWNEEIKEVSRV
jgi:hypothetical protein